MEINNLANLKSLRSAPQLNKVQRKKLLKELESEILSAEWITIGIMAFHDYEAVEALKSISRKYTSIKFTDLDSLNADGSVFLKGNQKTGNVFIRSENGLGEGVLLTCQYEKDSLESLTYGPVSYTHLRAHET